MLLRSRRLLPLLVTQTLTAFNDNLFKNALVVLLLFGATEGGGAALVAAVGAVFILPFALLSATAGQVADRFEMSGTLRRAKWAELGIMALAAAGLASGNVVLLFAVLLLLGVQATLLGPLKNALLPAHLAEHELVEGNGLMEAGTFLGILAGTVCGSALISLPGGWAVVAGAGLVSAAGGLWSACRVPPAPAADPTLPIGANVLRETVAVLGLIRRQPDAWRCGLGLSWFWVMGATVLTELPLMVRQELGGSGPVFTVALVSFSLGAAFGAVACNRVLRGAVSARLLPGVGIGITLFTVDLAWAAQGAPALPGPGAVLASLAGWRILIDLAGLAACGGAFSVPLYALLQDRADRTALARTVAGNNVLNAIGMGTAAAIAGLLASRGVAPSSVLLGFAAINLPAVFLLARSLRD